MKNNRTITKKIIAGKFKGKTLKLPSKETTRSSKAIVVESFFNTLQFDVIDSVLVEVFSGSGSIGLEALSRGAKKIIFMEKDRDAIKILRENIAQTDPSSCEVFEGDSFSNIAQVKKRLAALGESAFVYVDPPFSYREGMEEIYDKTIDMIASFPLHMVTLVIIEHMSTLELPDSIGSFNRIKFKRFGKTSLTYYA
ncbi:16S rRNA (guanine(966)-N(2))-methyltransferase RsmD [Sulfuricurvum sp.]|uniref:16S rRNA (guanine(966)-N(2))-methyltransferase RsmD n=1 Tax=Sulfuricurvum sp. TaxID=2025608 RepID=UPI0019A061DA|nr:16S rRNA (guanine(966)-N(2))-methyltransferase RsmD [Sulfuricurvum sp.]MBD3798898.1 16S rRNA (guanine(966)-N(2))-methyltransferase RsmD [Campylobacterota bacterium]MBD3805748.1 16S rRNA (guanine(966)-N(2))-methyltransferase RsmD [Sulfuricurvum sp.]